MTMREIKTGAFQGDVLVRRVAALPKGVIPMRREGDRLIVSHSETGHDHSIDDATVAGFEVPGNPLVCYLQSNGESFDLIHHRAWDTHEALRFICKPTDTWEVRRQREHTPEGWRRVAD